MQQRSGCLKCSARCERRTDSNPRGQARDLRMIPSSLPASRCSASNNNVCVLSTREFGIWHPGSRPFADSPLDFNRHASLRARRPEDDFPRDGLEHVLEFARTLIARAGFCSFSAIRMMATILAKMGILLLAQSSHTRRSFCHSMFLDNEEPGTCHRDPQLFYSLDRCATSLPSLRTSLPSLGWR